MEKKKIIVLGSAGNLGMYFMDYLMKNLDTEKYEMIATGTKDEYPFEFYNGKYVKLDDVRAYTADKNGILSGFAKYEEPEDNNQNSNSTAPNISTVNSTIQNTKNTNDATAKTGNLPKTGKNVLIGITVLLFIVVGVFTYFKYSYLKDI